MGSTSCDCSGQLARTICAARGTRAYDVLVVIDGILISQDDKSIRCIGDGEVGLILEEGRGKSFSLKYRAVGHNALAITIGRDLPDRRLNNAADCILAMVRRGQEWIDSKGNRHSEGYGPIRQKRDRKPPRRRSKIPYHEMHVWAR